MRCCLISRGRPRVSIAPGQVRRLADGPQRTTWKQIADTLGISVPTAMRLYKKSKQETGPQKH